MYLNKFLTIVFVALGASMVITASAVAETPNNTGYWQSVASDAQEAYLEEKLPLDIQVVATALDGPVYADAQGRTLYKWPVSALRNGSTGDRKDGPSNCTDRRSAPALDNGWPMPIKQCSMGHGPCNGE